MQKIVLILRKKINIITQKWSLRDENIILKTVPNREQLILCDRILKLNIKIKGIKVLPTG